MSTLHDAQALHVKLVAQLVTYVYAQGYELTWGEAYRTAQQAEWDAENHTGIVNSVHCDRLAVDLQLFKDGNYLTDPASYQFMADYWQSLDPSCRAGYYFSTVDADHFSITWEGRS
jgi:hypothetical protein